MRWWWWWWWGDDEVVMLIMMRWWWWAWWGGDGSDELVMVCAATRLLANAWSSSTTIVCFTARETPFRSQWEGNQVRVVTTMRRRSLPRRDDRWRWLELNPVKATHVTGDLLNRGMNGGGLEWGAAEEMLWPITSWTLTRWWHMLTRWGWRCLQMQWLLPYQRPWLVTVRSKVVQTVCRTVPPLCRLRLVHCPPTTNTRMTSHAVTEAVRLHSKELFSFHSGRRSSVFHRHIAHQMAPTPHDYCQLMCLTTPPSRAVMRTLTTGDDNEWWPLTNVDESASK